jgi:hypothetical protein
MSQQGREKREREPVLDYPLSVKVAELIKAEKYRCWYNARDALQRLPGLLLLANYTEGWLVMPKEEEVQVIEHGWISCANGLVVDPSIVLLEEPDQYLAYFPAIEVPWADAGELSGMPLPVAHLYAPGDELGHPDYHAAYHAALAHAQTLALASGKRVEVCPSEKTLIVMTQEGKIIIRLPD